jgi:hypothetical protein
MGTPLVSEVQMGDAEAGTSRKVAPITDFGKVSAKVCFRRNNLDRYLHELLFLSMSPQYDEDASFSYFWRHLLALLNKRRLYFMRDTRSWIFQYVVPVIFVLIGMLVMRVRNRNMMTK